MSWLPEHHDFAPPGPYDPAVALALIAALDRLCGEAEALLRSEHELVRAAVKDWHGATRTWFDRERSGVVEELRASVRAARAAASTVSEELAHRDRITRHLTELAVAERAQTSPARP